MASSNKLGTMIKEARNAKNLTQEKLAAKIPGVSASDISKMERGELVPSQDVLKKIAKATGITQTSLIEAAKSAKPSAGKTASAPKKPSASSATTKAEKLTATEKKFLEAYRKADSNTRKAALKVLNGESNSLLDTILGGGTPGGFGDAAQSFTENIVGNLVSGILGGLGK